MYLLKFKKIVCFLVCTVLLTFGRCVFAIEPSYVMRLLPDTNFYINRNGGISHNTYVIEMGNRKLFFKETKKKLSMYETAKRAINEYFKDNYKDDQESMLTSLLEDGNLKKFIYMKTYGDGQAAKWLVSEDKSDVSVLGFTNPLSYNFKEKILPDFLHYAFAEFVQYRANRNREIGDLQINQLLGSLAAVRIAEILGLSGLTVKTEYIEIELPSGEKKQGIVMDCAQGVPFEKLRLLENKSVSPFLQLNLSSLMILDALCAQRDRSVGNYFTVLSENGDIIGISAYDNDLSFDSYIDLKSRNFVLPPILCKDGMLSLPHMDKTLAHKILNLTCEDIRCCLKDLLNDSQIDATINRMRQIQDAIRQSVTKKPMFLLDPLEWNNQTINDELSIDNGTYFKAFINKLTL